MFIIFGLSCAQEIRRLVQHVRNVTNVMVATVHKFTSARGPPPPPLASSSAPGAGDAIYKLYYIELRELTDIRKLLTLHADGSLRRRRSSALRNGIMIT